jgi:hypothetical protein
LTCRWRLSLFLATLGAMVRWMLWSEDVGPEAVDLSLFLNFVVRMQQILVQDNTKTSLSTCYIDMCLAACSESVHRLIKPS